MFKTFKNSFLVRNSYTTNSIIWSLKGIPFLGKFLTSSLYSVGELKLLAMIVGIIREFFSTFLGKILYLAGVFGVAQFQSEIAPDFNFFGTLPTVADNYCHIMILMTVVGAFTNTQMFNPTRDKYYAMFLMRMDAAKYSLSNYYFFLGKMFIGLMPFSFLFGLICKTQIITCLLIPFFVVCSKMCATAILLSTYGKDGRPINENKLPLWVWMLISAICVLAVGLPVLGFALSETVLWIVTGVMFVAAIPAMVYTVNYKQYRFVYKELLTPKTIVLSAEKNAAGVQSAKLMNKKITADFTQTSNKSGYKYLNELFMKRHSKILTKSAKKISMVLVGILLVAIVAIYRFPDFKAVVNEMMLTYLPYFLFIMYLLNRGKTLTQAMFMNCDHSMLTYRFYRQPKAILTLFVERMKYVIGIDLMPSAIIALGLPLLLYLSGGTDQPLNYVVLFTTIIAMSIFFSVHNMVLYYLLQPYNVNLETKSATFGIVSTITYFVCYMGIQFRAPTLIFGVIVSAFCIVYAIVATILAYRLAPKTFKLRA